MKVDALTGAEMRVGRDVARRLIDDIGGLHPHWSRDECVAYAVMQLAEWEADEAAYRRVAARRGVLPL